MTAPRPIPALVVGLCSHGVGICRSLGRRGIPVSALESNAALPGLATRHAEVTVARDVNGSALIEDLAAASQRFDEKPVLYLTNDNMVRTVAKSFDDVTPHFRFNWSPPDLVLKLLDKQHIEERAEACGLRYPRSRLVHTVDDLEPVIAEFSFPVALKPTDPLSPFKAFQVESPERLRAEVERFQDRIARFLVQEWVTGGEPNIYFVNYYFGPDGKPLAEFVGRKIRSCPRHTGGASSAEPADREDIAAQARRFFEGLPVRGPAALEIKESNEGECFVIEPTIGRFDFYIETCALNGLDMAYIQYACQTGLDPALGDQRASLRGTTAWVDVERDLPGWIEALGTRGERAAAWKFIFRRKGFALWSFDDPRPSLRAWPRAIVAGVMKVLRKLAKIVLRRK